MASTVIVKDLGWGRILQELRTMDNSFSKVGFPDGEEIKKGNKRNKNKNSKAPKDMTEVATIAAWLNFGTKTNPKAWPFMFNSFMKNVAALIILRNKLYRAIVAGRMTTEKALFLMGEFMTGKTKKEITDLRTPANEPSTIKAKKSDNPLINTALMRNSVTHAETIK